jgi:hypothetical protein
MRYLVLPAVSTLQPGSTPASMTPSIVTGLGRSTGMPVGPGATVPPPVGFPLVGAPLGAVLGALLGAVLGAVLGAETEDPPPVPEPG